MRGVAPVRETMVAASPGRTETAEAVREAAVVWAALVVGSPSGVLPTRTAPAPSIDRVEDPRRYLDRNRDTFHATKSQCTNAFPYQHSDESR